MLNRRIFLKTLSGLCVVLPLAKTVSAKTHPKCQAEAIKKNREKYDIVRVDLTCHHDGVSKYSSANVFSASPPLKNVEITYRHKAANRVVSPMDQLEISFPQVNKTSLQSIAVPLMKKELWTSTNWITTTVNNADLTTKHFAVKKGGILYVFDDYHNHYYEIMLDKLI